MLAATTSTAPAADGDWRQRPPFDQLAHHPPELCTPQASLDELSAALARRWPHGGLAPRFVRQDPRLLRDGLHFEQRIRLDGRIATRPGSWHDLYSALMWIDYPRLKWALNGIQVAELPIQGRGNRTRWQQALTHVDEAGILLAAEDPEAITALHRHDWRELFVRRRGDWGRRIVAHVFGHALYELARRPFPTLAGKALCVVVPPGFVGRPFEERRASLDRQVADAIASGRLGRDPARMPSLPLAGIPGFDPRADDPDWIETAPCFRPLPAGRGYEPPLVLSSSGPE